MKISLQELIFLFSTFLLLFIIKKRRLKILLFLCLTSLTILTLFSALSLRVPVRPFVVLSQSMKPYISAGSLIFVKKDVKALQKGDVITFMRPDNLNQIITHRIYEAEKNGINLKFKTKGDANKSLDQWTIEKNMIFGKVIFVLPFLGYLINFAKTKIGVIIIIVIPLFIIILGEIRVIMREWKKLLILLLTIFSYFFNPADSLAGFSEEVDATGLNIATNCWEAPSIPQLLSPVNNITTNNSDISLSWSDVDSSCVTAVVTYQAKIYTDSAKNNLYNESNWISETSYSLINISDQEYWWEVQAKDQFDNISVSTLRHFTINQGVPSASLSISDFWLKQVEEKFGNNADFEKGDLTDWTSTGSAVVLSSDTINDPTTTVSPFDGNYMVRLGNPENPGNWIWENRLMRSIESGAKSLSLNYNFFSRDSTGFDTPGFLIRLNGQEIFRHDNLNSDGIHALNTDWQQFYYDLSSVGDSKINLNIQSGNTGDKNQQSWVYLDNLTTYFASSPITALFTISSADTDLPVDSIKYKSYKEGEAEPLNWTIYSNPFSLSEAGIFNLIYRITDNANNTQDYRVKINVDDQVPAQVTDLDVDPDSFTANSGTLTWTAVGNDSMSGRAATYDIRYQKNCWDDPYFDFDTATKVEKAPVPKTSGTDESLVITGLEPWTYYCFALKVADEAPNWSLLSNIVIVSFPIGLAVNPGDVVINEMMWMGSSISGDDEWLELRNMTDRELSLDGLYLTKLDQGSESQLGIDLTGYSISPHGYFLIANSNSYSGAESRLKFNPNIWSDSLDLSNDNLQINLYDASGNLIDTAWDGSAPSEGYFDNTGQRYYSMERVSIPGDGSNPLSWYTCIDEASSNDFFDGGVDERGTPGGSNRSENEPLTHQKLLTRIMPTILPFVTPLITTSPVVAPEANLNLSEDKKSVTFTLNNITDFTEFNYELTYDSNIGLQGISGRSDLIGENDFEKKDIILGTCSSGGTCIYHTDIKNLKLKVKLKNKNKEEIKLEKEINISS